MKMNNEIPAIKLLGLTKYYGSYPGVLDINLEINESEIFGFLGPNGAGKSTTIRCIIGLIKPTQGEIVILGKNSRNKHIEICKDIGYLPGDIGLYKDMTGNEYLNHLIKLRKEKNCHKSKEKLLCLKNKFKIDFDKKIGTYSKGMRQIVGIIQAFMHEPKLIILDEPTSGLDPMMQEEFFNLILEEKKNGKTIFLSSHILSEIEKVCDRVAIIKKGKLIHVEEMSSYRSIVGKNIKIEPAGSLEDAFNVIREMSEAVDVVLRNGQIEFHYRGEMEHLISILTRLKIRDFSCETPRIEDIFFKYYEDK
jgi:ABC-2 type transport system ATP-binding protein